MKGIVIKRTKTDVTKDMDNWLKGIEKTINRDSGNRERAPPPETTRYSMVDINQLRAKKSFSLKQYKKWIPLIAVIVLVAAYIQYLRIQLESCR